MGDTPFWVAQRGGVSQFVLSECRPVRKLAVKDKLATAWSGGYIPLALAVIAVILVPVGFVTGISAALNGSGSGPHASEAVFFVGVALALVALVASIIALARRGAKVVPIIAMVVSLLPGIFILVLFIAARA